MSLFPQCWPETAVVSCSSFVEEVSHLDPGRGHSSCWPGNGWSDSNHHPQGVFSLHCPHHCPPPAQHHGQLQVSRRRPDMSWHGGSCALYPTMSLSFPSSQGNGAGCWKNSRIWFTGQSNCKWGPFLRHGKGCWDIARQHSILIWLKAEFYKLLLCLILNAWLLFSYKCVLFYLYLY